MKVVFTGDNWEEVNGEELFLPRPVRRDILEELLQRAKKVYMPPSTYERISKKIKEKYGDKIAVMSIRGRYGRYDPQVIATVAALRKSGLSIRKIAKEVGLPKSTVHYILTKLRKVEVYDERIILG